MRKIQKIYESTQEINFISPQREFSLYFKAFQESELGGIHKAIPWNELVKSLKIRRKIKGPDPIFSPQGVSIQPITY